MKTEKPVKPEAASEKTSKIVRFFRFRKEMFKALPERLYRAKVAEVRTPFYKSYLINQTDIVREVLSASNDLYPKSRLVYNSLHDLLGNCVFVSNGETWKRQRRITNPAFEGGRIKEVFPRMRDAVDASIERMQVVTDNQTEYNVEFESSHLAADVIFRTLFSTSIDDGLAQEICTTFQKYQAAQPIWNPLSLIRAPEWMPRIRNRSQKTHAAFIRDALGTLIVQREKEIEAGTAPNDLGTKIMTTPDPETGVCFTGKEMSDHMGIFFLAGHETTATAIGWTLYLLAFDQEIQERVYQEVKKVCGDKPIEFTDLAKLKLVKNVFNEALRLYAPVPFIAREFTKKTQLRDREANPGDLCLLSPWFSGRHEQIWENPDHFDPDRWDNLPKHCRDAFFPFSAGERICTGAGFAQIESALAIAAIVRAFHFTLGHEAPEPVAYLTTRTRSGIMLDIKARA